MRIPFRRASDGDVAFFHDFRPPPYGGSNQFLLALRGEFDRRGVSVAANRIGNSTRAALLNSWLVDERRLRRGLHPACFVVHRLDGPLARYRGYDDGTDARIVALNHEFAQRTVFQSRYSLEAHRELGLDVRDPRVVPNAVDPAIFHAPAARGPLGERVRLIATSWSDNPNKGFAALAWLDRHLDPSRYEFTFVGRSPIAFERIRSLGALPSRPLAAELRAHDVFVFPSRHESASNALLEALACGLPAVYHHSGGNAEIAGEAGFAFEEVEEVPGLLERLADEYEQRRSAIAVPTIEDVGTQYLDALGVEQ